MAGFWTGAQSTPTRNTSEQALDHWNQRMRASDTYQNFMRRNGLPTDGRVKLSRSQQGALERELERAGAPIPKGMHIDQGGNLNQKNRLVRNLAIGAGIVAGGYYAAPLLAGGGAAGAGGAGGAGAAGAGGAGAAGTGGTLLGTTGWTAPMATYAAPVAASGVGGGVGGATVAGVAGGVGAAGAAGTGGGVAGGAGAAGTAGTGGSGLRTALSYGIPAAGSIINGVIQSRASNRAAETQSAAADRAMGLNEQIYNDTRQVQQQVDQRNQDLYAPYTSLGAGATGNLRGLVGLPAMAPPSANSYQQTQQTAAAAMPDMAAGAGGGAVRRPPADTPHVQASMATESAYARGSLGSLAGGVVMLEAPDGSRRAVPEAQAEHYMALGARRVA